MKNDSKLIQQAYQFALKAHLGQERESGEEFISHPLGVAEIVSELGMDEASIAAALLHDVPEDTGVGLEEIRQNFGEEIAGIVDGLTKVDKLSFTSKLEEQAGNLRKMILAMAKDIRVIIIKLADRLHNMRTLSSLEPSRRQEIAEETRLVFAPLAHRLGMWQIRRELEDLAFKYLEPREFKEISGKVDKTWKERQEDIQGIMDILKEKLKEAKIKAEIQGRPKHFYSIYQKMQKQSINFDKIYDLSAIRIIVETVSECYSALGIVHSLWVPIPGFFSDYIARPKPNMYQSLHTKVIGPRGEPLEIQIRTREMHRTAEYGVAAHWRYKEGDKRDIKFEDKLSWLRQILDLQKDLKDSQEFLESLKLDLFRDQVFVFTPKGDVIDLPAGSTPVDFAYRIHTQIGHCCVGAKVNGKLVPLDYRLKNGEIVEIVTSKLSSGPSLDWLAFVQTSEAKSRIKAFYRKKNREEAISKGRELLIRELQKHGLAYREIVSLAKWKDFVENLRFSGEDDFLAAMGYGELPAAQVVRKLMDQFQLGKPEAPKPEVVPKKRQGELRIGISAKGVDNLLFKLSKCCMPVPGDKIAGFVTRGKGVSIHRIGCPNLSFYQISEPERLMEVQWAFGPETFYPVEIRIEALDRIGLLKDISAIISEAKTNIRSAKVKTRKNQLAFIELVLDVSSLQHLNNLITSLQQLSDVLAVHRVGG